MPSSGRQGDPEAVSSASPGTPTHPWPALTRKDHSFFRIGFQNVNGFPSKSGDYKDLQLHELLQQYHFQVFGMVETNVYWPKTPFPERLPSRIKRWFQQIHVSVAHNTNEHPTTTSQRGGTALISKDQAALRVMDSGKDPTNLGRWVWTRFRGKNHLTLRVVVAYRPTKSRGPTTVYAQQRRYFLNQLQQKCPRKAFITDLAKAIKHWQQTNDQILLMVDANEDTRSGKLFQAMQALNMTDLYLNAYQATQLPNTYNGGSKPIDTCYGTPGLAIRQIGYANFDEGISSDHRCLWLDLDFNATFGNRYPLQLPRARRLQLANPAVVKKYLNSWKAFIKQHHLSQRAFDLEHSCLKAGTMTPTQQAEYEAIDKLRMEGIRHAESRCRKLCMGSVPWTPQLSHTMKAIRWCKLSLSKLKGRKISSRTLQRLKASIQSTTDHTSEQSLVDELKAQQKKFSLLCKSAEADRLQWLTRLADQYQNHGLMTKHKAIIALQKREEARTTARRIKAVQHKLQST